MRILVLTQHYPPDICSTGYLCSTVAERRADQGDVVTVLTGRSGYVGAASDTVHETRGVEVRRVWSTRLGRSSVPRRLVDLVTFCLAVAWQAFWLPRQDVILSVTTPPFMIWAAVLHKLRHPSTKIVLWSMDCYPEVAERSQVIRAGGVISRSWRFLNRRLYRWLSAVVCLDQAMEDLLRPYDTQGVVHFPIIPNWERSDVFAWDTLPPPWPGAAALPLDGKLVVLYMGNAGYGHEFDTLIEAARKLQDAPVVFVLVGGGRRWHELETAKSRYQLDNVLLLGYLNLPKEQTPALMRCAQLALITLRNEMLGVMSPSKLHASLATGLGIAYVGPEDSNVAEAVRRFDCGFRVPVGAAEELADRLRLLAADQVAVAELQRAARHAFESAYCDAKTLPLFDRLFAALLKGEAFAQPNDSEADEASASNLVSNCEQLSRGQARAGT
jgi:glycosyltransferase involved in cell wall biosynthesis